MKKLSIKHILILHELLIKNTGGASGMRDEGLLESAVNTPFATFDSTQLYPTIQLYFGTVQLNRSEHDVWLMPIGKLLDLWTCHKQFLGWEKAKREVGIDEILPI